MMTYEEQQAAKKFLADQLKYIGFPSYFRELDDSSIRVKTKVRAIPSEGYYNFFAAMQTIRQRLHQSRVEQRVLPRTWLKELRLTSRAAAYADYGKFRPSATVEVYTSINKSKWNAEGHKKTATITISPSWATSTRHLQTLFAKDYFCFHSRKVGNMYRVRLCRYIDGELVTLPEQWLVTHPDADLYGLGVSINAAKHDMEKKMMREVRARLKA